MKILEKTKEIAFAFDKNLFPKNCLHLSCIFYKGRIVSIGQNSKKTHPTNLRNPKINKDGVDISSFRGTCSELKTIKNIINTTNIPISKSILVNIRINKNNKIRNSKPCSSCQKLLSYYQFSKIIYSSGDNENFIKMIL